MDAFVDELLKQLALEGSNGCLLSRLWSLLQAELPINGLDCLDEGSKNFIWTAFVSSRRKDFEVYLTEMHGLSLGLIDPEAEREIDGANRIKLPIDHEKNLDSEFLKESESLLIASEGCRYRVLGVCDAMTSRFKLSEKQLETLEEIGKARTTGCLQSDLARSVGIEHKNFFFIMKQLEGRNLAVRNPIILNRGEADSTQSATTNIIHLPQFAPDIKLQQFQTFRMVEGSDNEDEEDVESGVYRMRDDAFYMRQVCEKIGTTIDQTALEFDIKQALGFRGSKGHRLWRRLKKKMVDLELMETFVASVNGKPSLCIRLIAEDFDDWLRKQRVSNKSENLPGPESSILVEQSLNRQLLEMIIEAGPHGISSRDLFSKLRLNSKKNTYRLKHLQTTFGVQLHTESRGKSAVNRCFAPVSILQKLASKDPTQNLPQPTISAPPGGWMMSVQKAINLGCDLVQELSLEEVPVPLMEEAEDSDEAPNSLPSYPDPTDEVQKKMRDYLFSNIISSRSDFRYKQLLERIRQTGFILRSNIGNFFKEQELAHGVKSDGKSPDRKTIDRVIHRLTSDQKIKKIKVSVLQKTGGEPKQVDVLIRNDLVINSELLTRIRQANRVFSTTCRRRSHIKTLSQIQEAQGQPIPVIKNLTRLTPSSYKPIQPKSTPQGESCHQVHRNGFIQAKMVRAKLLHNLICRLVGLAGCQPILEASEGTTCQEPGFPRFVDPTFIEKTQTTDSSSFQDSKSYRFAKTTREDQISSTANFEGVKCENLNSHSFTPRQLWDAMPTDLYLQIVGSNQNCDELILQSGSNLRMDQVPVEKQVLLVDRGSRNRLAELLELLCRMELLENTIGAGSSPGSGLMEYSQFIVYTTGTLEEPVVSTDASGSITQISKKLVKFSFDSLDQLESFWMHLEFVFSAQRHLSTSCFPATRVPEICSASNWSISKLMSMAKWLELSQVMEREAPIDWKKCREIANRMNISYQQVLSFSYERRRKQKIKKSALEALQSTPAPVQTPPQKRRRQQIPDPVEEPEVESEDLRSSVYWCRTDDHRLLSAFVLWRSSNEAPASKNRTVNWKGLNFLPGGSSSANLNRCKRRFKHLQKQDSLFPLIQSLESICDKLYTRRLARLQNSVPVRFRDPGSSLIDEYCTLKKLKEHTMLEMESLEGDQSENPLDWNLPEDSFVSGEILQSMLESCHPEDEDLVKELKRLVAEITEKAPRMIKKESEMNRSGPISKQKTLESNIDWNSSVVSLEKKRKTLGFRLGKDRLTSCHHDLSLPVSLAKDFIVSCMITSQSNKYLTEDMAKELITRFKDDEMLQALSYLHQQGWINPGGVRCPINLSPKFKNQLKIAGLSSKFFSQAQNAKQDFEIEEQDEDFLTSVNSVGKIFKDSEVSAGSLAALLAGVVREDLELTIHPPLESTAELSLDFKVKCKMTGNHRSSASQKRSGTAKTTFTELLKGTEMEIESELNTESQEDVIKGHSNDQSRILLELINKTGDQGITQQELQQEPELTNFDDISQLLEDLKSRGEIFCFGRPKGSCCYLSKDSSRRFLFEREQEMESKSVQIRPWRDHEGEINLEFLEKIQLSIMDTVIDHPGISEDHLIDQISYCDVHNAKELITAMTKQSLLKTEQSTVLQNTSKPSIFKSLDPPVEDRMVFYFPNLESCFQTRLPVTEFLN